MSEIKRRIQKLVRSSEFENATEEEIIDALAIFMADSMIDLLRPCIEQRLKQFLPLIKEGLST